MIKSSERFARRERRVRYALSLRANARPRLSVFRSGRHIYCQVIDDSAGRTLVAASSLEKTLREELKGGADRAAAKRVGQLLAERAKSAGIEQVVFDRGGYKFHGRVQALAEGAREGGLSF
jgi:large subunit ribosomal protein L18